VVNCPLMKKVYFFVGAYLRQNVINIFDFIEQRFGAILSWYLHPNKPFSNCLAIASIFFVIHSDE